MPINGPDSIIDDMTNFEKIIIHIALVCGTLFVFLTKGGISFFASGDAVRGTFFLMVSVLTVLGWVAPLIQKYRPWGLIAGRWLAVLLALFSVYGFVRENFMSSLPPAWP